MSFSAGENLKNTFILYYLVKEFFFVLNQFQSHSSATVNIASGPPFVSVYDVQFGGFQTNNS